MTLTIARGFAWPAFGEARYDDRTGGAYFTIETASHNYVVRVTEVDQ